MITSDYQASLELIGYSKETAAAIALTLFLALEAEAKE